jgi:hypothetical protein
MLGNVNYPVRVRLHISLKNGNVFNFSCQIPESERQLIEKLYALSTKVTEQVLPNQLTLDHRTLGPAVKAFTTVDGRTLETTDGVSWTEVQPLKSRPFEKELESRKHPQRCSEYGIDCGTEKCVLTDCSALEFGIIERERNEKALQEAKGALKKRGRKPKQPGNPVPKNITPVAETAPQIIEPEIEPVKHSGELCQGKVCDCSSNLSRWDCKNCVYRHSDLTTWSGCKRLPHEWRCDDCTDSKCVFHSTYDKQLCQVRPDTEVCEACANPYCVVNRHPKVFFLKKDAIAPSPQEGISYFVHGCSEPISKSCRDGTCQVSECRMNSAQAEILCVSGFPNRCNNATDRGCRNERCPYYRFESNFTGIKSV